MMIARACVEPRASQNTMVPFTTACVTGRNEYPRRFDVIDMPLEPTELKISGSRGHVRLPVAWRIDYPTEVAVARSVGWGIFEEDRFPIPVVDAYRLELDGFAAAARGEAAPVPNLDESVATALTMDALLASADTGAGVEVEAP